jgi:hypothetical protein
MINTSAIIGQLIASRFPRAISGYLLGDWDGHLPYDYIKSDADILADFGGEEVSGGQPEVIDNSLGWIAATDCNNLNSLNCNATNVSRMFVTRCTSLLGLACTSIGNTQFTTLDLSTDTALESIECYNNCLTTLILPNINNISFLNASRCQLTQTVVDNIVIALAASSVYYGNLIIGEGPCPCGGSNEIPTPSVAYTALTVTKGWTVTTN